MMKMRFASLFSGCGGLDRGFIEAGYTCAAAFDIDKNAVSAYQKNIGSHIHQVDIEKAGRDVVDAVSSAEILVAGPPCQGFSTAGKNDPQDARNSLLLKVADIAALAKPRVVLIENVRGLLSSRYRPYWDALIGKLTENGYSVSYRITKATEFGVPQNRQRIIILAVRGGPPIEIKFPSVPHCTIKDVLKGLDQLDGHAIRSLPEDSIEFEIAKHIKPGQKLSNVRRGSASVHTWDIPKVFGAITRMEREVLDSLIVLRRQKRRRDIGDADPVLCQEISKFVRFPAKAVLVGLIDKGYVRKVGNFYDLTNSFNGKFRRLSWDNVAPTVDTRFGQPRYFLHPDEHRGFTVREAARIQAFPDSFCFDMPSSVAFRLIGNAVPPPMAKAIAQIIDSAGRMTSC